MSPTSPELRRLEVLRAFKRRMPRLDAAENVSPFDDRVSTAGGPAAGDLPEIHAEVRQRIRQVIEDVRDGRRKSQVILLAGDAGTGKTHLLRTFQAPGLADEVGYVHVCGSNHWAVQEFEARLLDWMVESLTAPSPSQEHLLLGRVRAIRGRALEHLLANPAAWRQCRARSRTRWLGWLRAPYDWWALRAPTDPRDPAAFRALDFARFSEYVCDRFLSDKSNLAHRYALRVLLTYLFPDRHESGVGSRERVLHWLRGRAENHYFTRRLGADERLDRQFGRFEAVKLLVHLFSPTVSGELSTEKEAGPPRVFLLVFDQAEGRNELFEGDKDWMDFFAHLSELYNTLPNVVVLFTMSLGLRNRLHGLMERQFRDRIRMDETFTLHLPDKGQVLALYRSRVERWLQGDPALLESYRGLDNPYLPLDRDGVLETAGQQSVRDTLEAFDRAFHQVMHELVVEPEFDFHYCLNELRPREAGQKDFEYTAGHLDTVRELLELVEAWLPAEYSMAVKVELLADANPATLSLRFEDRDGSGAWACAYLAKLGYRGVQDQLDRATELLAHRQKARYTLWPLRAGEIKAEPDPRRKDQIFPRATPAALQSRLRALVHLAGRRPAYEEAGCWASARDLIRREFDRTYLGEVFREARRRLDGIRAGTLSDTNEEPAPAGP